MSGLDLILMDTAGRSPKDDIKIQELKAFLTEAGADEVHLVLSSVAGARTLEQTAERFAAVGTHRADPHQARRGHRAWATCCPCSVPAGCR